jgi:tetratricopeptide (TPR) repeat protein
MLEAPLEPGTPIMLRTLRTLALIGVATAAPHVAAQEAMSPEQAIEAVAPLYLERDQPGVGAKAIAILDQAIAANPDHVELRWRVARFHFWLADTASSDSVRISHAKTCWDHAEKVKQLAPQQVHGHYWAMACIGAYSEGVGIVNAVRQGLAGKFEDNGLKAVSIDASIDQGGPLRGMGRYYDQLPWPLRDADKSRDYLGRALSAGPSHARNLYFMADLELEEGDEDAARELLNKVLALSVAGSGNPPEVRLFHKKARALLAEIDG